MSDKLNLRDLWHQQEVVPPKPSVVIKKAQRLKKIKLYQLLFINSISLVTILFIGAIWYYYQPQFISTKIGSALVILGLFLFTIFQNSMFPLLKIKEINLSNRAYLALLLKIKEKQLFLQTTALNSYFLLFSLGLALYLVEPISSMSVVLGLFCYGSTLIWILINWFYFRPKIIKKQQIELNELIDQLKKLKSQ